MGFGSTRNCDRAASYEECQRIFSNNPRPRQAGWDDNERPLDNARKHHYRVVRGGNENYYDAVLYSTVMARYYRPEEGGRRVCYNYDNRKLSSQFMWRVTHSAKVMDFTTTAGARVQVPVGPASRYDGFGADLWRVGDKIDISRSKHRPVQIPRMSDELKAWKKEVRLALAPVFELMKYAAAEAATHQGGIVAGYKWGHFSYDTTHWQLHHQGWAPPQPLTEPVVQILVKMYNERIEHILDVNARQLNAPALIRSVEKAMIGALTPLFRGKTHRYEDVPQFPEHLPTNFLFV